MEMEDVLCKEVIVANLTRRGDGTKYSPMRIVTQVFEKDGTLIAEKDPVEEKFVAFDLVHFARWCIDSNFESDKITPYSVIQFLDSIKEK